MTERFRISQDRIKEMAFWNREIPGIWWLIDDLRKLNICCPADFKGRDPVAVYEAWKQVSREDRPVALLFFRCAVYLADTPPKMRDPKLSKWWNWA